MDPSFSIVFIGTQFPPWLQTQTNLNQLSMKNVSIYGAIPDWFLTARRHLKEVDLSNNYLNGNIPQQLCNLTSLLFLSLRDNNLIGSIPSCLGALSNLNVLDLGNNNLSGHIPSELGSMFSLYTLHLDGNQFSGELPNALQNLTHLATLDLGQNELRGSIPPWIGNDWSSLQYLRLESNNISGDIPVTLCQLPSLQIMNLALNNLVGTIPPCFGNLSMMISEEKSLDSLRHIALNEQLLNVFKGNTMTYTSSLSYAKFISLSGNHLHGEIPTELMNLKGLQSLNLSNNELTGMIPESINNLTHLESLDLSMNQISGIIPQSLADIDALGYLNLSFNNLKGKVPSGGHFDTFGNASIYQGNSELCGKVLMKSCPGDDSATSNQPNGPVSDADEEFEFLWLIAGTGPGFAVGFLTVMCILYFKDSWRIAYFGFVDNVYNKVRANFTIKVSYFWSKFC